MSICAIEGVGWPRIRTPDLSGICSHSLKQIASQRQQKLVGFPDRSYISAYEYLEKKSPWLTISAPGYLLPTMTQDTRPDHQLTKSPPEYSTFQPGRLVASEN